jgi:hypothetical protein
MSTLNSPQWWVKPLLSTSTLQKWTCKPQSPNTAKPQWMKVGSPPSHPPTFSPLWTTATPTSHQLLTSLPSICHPPQPYTQQSTRPHLTPPWWVSSNTPARLCTRPVQPDQATCLLPSTVCPTQLIRSAAASDRVPWSKLRLTHQLRLTIKLEHRLRIRLHRHTKRQSTWWRAHQRIWAGDPQLLQATIQVWAGRVLTSTM